MTNIKVKTLVWMKDTGPQQYPQRYKAMMPCGSGDYSVSGSERDDKWQWFRNGFFVAGHQLHDPMPLADAKTAAQADYERRIMSAIEIEETE